MGTAQWERLLAIVLAMMFPWALVLALLLPVILLEVMLHVATRLANESDLRWVIERESQLVSMMVLRILQDYLLVLVGTMLERTWEMPSVALLLVSVLVYWFQARRATLFALVSLDPTLVDRLQAELEKRKGPPLETQSAQT